MNASSRAIVCFWGSVERVPRRGRLWLPDCRIASSRRPRVGARIQVCAPSRAYPATVVSVGEASFRVAFEDAGVPAALARAAAGEPATRAVLAERARLAALDWIERL